MVEYNWNTYRAIDTGKTVFANRYHLFQQAIGTAIARSHYTWKGLEFGCGDGGTTAYIPEKLRLFFTAIDVDESALEIAAKKPELSKVRFRKKDFLKIRSGDYGTVVAGFVVHNFPNPEKIKFIQKASDITCPGGMLILGDVMTFDNPDRTMKEWISDYDMLKELPVKQKKWWERHFSEYDRPMSAPASWYETAMKVCGFEPEIEYRDGFWTVISGRKL